MLQLGAWTPKLGLRGPGSRRSSWHFKFDVSEIPGLDSVETMTKQAWRLGFRSLDCVDVDATKQFSYHYFNYWFYNMLMNLLMLASLLILKHYSAISYSN